MKKPCKFLILNREVRTSRLFIRKVEGTRKGSNFYTDIQAVVDAHTLVDDDAV
jgi:hypothetical protein